MGAISIGVFDDHPILVSGVTTLLADWSAARVTGSGATATELLQFAEGAKPDVVVTDLRMPGDVLAAILSIATSGRRTKVLVFTASTDIDIAVTVLEAGATGYMLKGCSIDELKQAILAVHAGETFIAPGFAAKIVAGLRAKSLRRTEAGNIQFSTREEQVLRLLLRGSTNKEIAGALSISDKTVKHYMTILMQKLNARNRIEAVLAAQQLEKRQYREGPVRHI